MPERVGEAGPKDLAFKSHEVVFGAAVKMRLRRLSLQAGVPCLDLSPGFASDSCSLLGGSGNGSRTWVSAVHMGD